MIIHFIIHLIKQIILSFENLFYLSFYHGSMFTNDLEITNSSKHIVTQVFNRISISFQLSTNICIEIFLFNNKVIKFIQALTSRFSMRNMTFIKSIERIYLYYLCRGIKTMYFFNRQ